MNIFGVIGFILFLFVSFTGVIIIIGLVKKYRSDKLLRNNIKSKLKSRSKSEVSIIIPVYNESKAIVNCLKHVIYSKYPKSLYEIILVDDGSTDNTVAIARDFGSKHKKEGLILRIIKANHKGKSEALNLGTNHAKHEIVLHLDVDILLEPDALAKMLEPFSKTERADGMDGKKVGATIGTYRVGNKKNMLTAFQTIEYSYNSLIRLGFSRTFGDSIWFYGAMSCYRKSALQKLGGMQSDTETEDMDIAIRLQNAGYNIIHIDDAYSKVIVPDNLRWFFKQRIRWWTGVLHSMKKNNKRSFDSIKGRIHSRFKFDKKKNSDYKISNSKVVSIKGKSIIPLIFVYLSQWWWSIFSLICIPMYFLQVLYWLPYNLGTFHDTFMYLFRWFSVFGPTYSIYKIPEWGVSLISIFGILTGLISVTFIIVALTIFKEGFSIRNVLAIVFYFPYTIILNVVMLISFIKFLFTKSKGFVR
jgi:cellulose synthase/poly-beta-1,6-N-acetylglucosamine synthase-like glycosyltransferase